jgi:Na+/melibiose symporter-like transporter
MGYITDKYGFFLNFCLYGAMMVTMLLAVGFGLPDRSKKEQARYDHANQSETLQRPDPKLLAKAICRLPVILWLMEVIVIGSGMAMVESFLFVYLQNDFKASTRLCGWTVGVTVLFELPIFHFSQQLLQRLGHDALFIISMTAYVTRVFGYTLLTESSVHWVLPLEVLHGITFASMWIASIDFSATVAPAEWSTTVQSILSSSFGCFGSVLGSLVGGWVMQTYSASVMYRGIGCVMFGMLALHVIVWAGCGLGHDVFLKKLTQERRIEAEEHHEDRLGDADKKETLRDNKKESNDDDAV